MKQFKFRGKDKYTGKYVYGDLIHFSKSENVAIRSTEKHCSVLNPDTQVDPDSVAQFVGYDKHGIEIYEGDKVLDYDSETVVARLIPFFRFEDVNNAGVYPVGYQFDIFTLKESQDETI